MKKIVVLCAALAVCQGCFTSATFTTREEGYENGKLAYLRMSKGDIFSQGDKESRVAVQGMFADGGDDLGAGVKAADASQKSTGVDAFVKSLADAMSAMEPLIDALRRVKSLIPDQAEAAGE